MPRGRPITPRSRYLLTPRMVADRYGLPAPTVRTMFRAMERDGQVHRFEGAPRLVFVDVREVERRLGYAADGASSGTT